MNQVSAKSSTCQRVGNIARNVAKGVYHGAGKFANFGSVAEDSIYYHTYLAQKADEKKKGMEMQAQRAVRKVLS
tara:strand:- start:2233 stop:2454 length:222 start_codon:yes stop_codon:yes gene_type:complete